VDGNLLLQDEQMADEVFHHFSSIIGSPGVQLCRINFPELGFPSLLSPSLDACFTEEEVWQAIQDMPVDKAPGPDGFTGLFYRSTWQIIKHDIMQAFHALWSLDGRCLHLLDQAFMVLLRKKPDAETVGDYRPISLIHSFAKLFTKVLARRLAPRMHSLVKSNQSAFIQTRLIHENYKAVNLTGKFLHRQKVPSALLKLDIAKAFDTVNWQFLLELLSHLGFSRRWNNWISLMLSTASTKVILNGSPGKRICHARGLRQGDPL